MVLLQINTHSSDRQCVETPLMCVCVCVCRNPNGKALKVAGLTVLACLLLAGQALTAYMVWGQKEHISALTSGQEKLKTELTRKISGISLYSYSFTEIQ